MAALELILPSAPSLNHVYRNVKINLRIITPIGKAWQCEVRQLAKIAAAQQRWQYSSKEKLVMELWIYWPDARRRDCDNVLKLLSDTLEGVLFEDDCWVLPRVMDFEIDREKPRVKIRLSQMAAVKKEPGSALGLNAA